MDCSMEKRLYHLETNNGRGHYQILGTNNKSNNLRLRPVFALRPKSGVIKVDAGKQGAIFLASSQRNAKKQFVIKVCPTNSKLKTQTSAIEFKICQKLYKVVPRRVPRPIKFFTCTNFVPEFIWENKNTNFTYSKQTVTCMEYIENGTFGNYLKRMAASPRKRLNDTIFKSFIAQVLMILFKIQKKYPEFIHGDLHLDNLLVRPVRPIPELVITDFGWTKINNTIGQLFEYKEKWTKDYGFGSKMCQMYDAHLFMMQLRLWVLENASTSKDGLPQTKQFLNMFVPVGFRKENDIHTNKYRLKYGTNYPFNLKNILSSDYFKKSGALKVPVRKNKIPVKNTKRNTNLNSNLLRITPESANLSNKNVRTRRGLLIAYGGGPSPNKKDNISVKAKRVSNFKIKSPKYK